MDKFNTNIIKTFVEKLGAK
jgi:hypothetical protein